ncbi:MAG: hypothetical protein ACOX62_12240 [Christensenellales bacterium]|jgi:hypothetical protein
MSRTKHQNILFSLFITVLGMIINIFHTMADRMALFLSRPASDAGMLISTYALGSLISVVLSTRMFPQRGGSAMGMMMLGAMGGMTVFPFLIGTLPQDFAFTFITAACLAGLVILLSMSGGMDKTIIKEARHDP